MANESVQYTISLRDLMSTGLTNLDAKMNKLEGSLKNVNSAATKTESGFSKFGAGLKTAFAAVGIGVFAKSVLDTGVSFESARVRLNTLLKSSVEADKVFEQIKKDAATTPFSFKELLDGNAALISTGLSADKAREDILALGNAVAATGGNNEILQRMTYNLQQIRNNGKASAVDIKQFGIAGINIFQLLAASTGKSKEELQGMDITYEVLTKALQDAREEGGLFANGLENMSKSVGGQISNLGDNFDAMKDKFFIASRTGIQAGIDGLIKLMEIGFKLGEILADLFGWIEKNKEVLKVLSVVVLSVVGYFKLMALGSALMAIQIGGATVATGGLATAFTALSLNPFVLAIAGASAFLLVLVAINAHLKDVRRNNFEKGITDMKKQAANTALENIKGVSGTDNQLRRIASEKELIKIDLERQRAVLKNGTGSEKLAALKQIAIGKSQLATISEYGRGLLKQTIPDSQLKESGETTKKASSKTKSLGSNVEKVSGQRSQVININIGKMIDGFNITTNTMGESLIKIREQVIQTMVTAINDSQVIAG